MTTLCSLLALLLTFANASLAISPCPIALNRSQPPAGPPRYAAEAPRTFTANTPNGVSDQHSSPSPTGPATEAVDSWSTLQSKLLDKWTTINSVTARMVTHLESSTKDGVRLIDGAGTYELLKHDGKTLIRTQVTNESTVKGGEADRTVTESILTVTDGATVLSTTTRAGAPQTVRRESADARPVMCIGGPKLVETLARSNPTIRPTDTINGERVIVVETRSKEGVPPTLHYISEQTGLLIRMEMNDAASDSRRSLNFEAVKVNVSLDPAGFRLDPAPTGK